ncbi:MAG: GNAT family N-acetyltransferase [Chloroflexota bacterium]|nr:MAG: GNAT family N-acetyltransferase [Chloroflexota bacterium]
MAMHKPESRPVRPEDYWPIHRLIGETMPITPLGFNGDIRRWEGKRFYDKNPAGDPDWCKNSQLWPRPSGQPAAVAHPDSPGYPALLVHPDYRRLEPEMIAWAEEHLSRPLPEGKLLEEGKSEIQFYVYDYDAQRQRLLADRGYQKMTSGGTIRRLRFGQQSLARPALAAGYRLRTTDPEDDADAQQIADLLNAAFNRDFHNATEYQNFARQAPSFQPDLDLVAITPDGAFAAYVGIPYDQANQLGIFEPVCTHPDHRQKGLARALMREGLLRLSALGAHYAMVDTGDMIPANRLYDAIGFGEVHQGAYWRKIF